jgi:hypothetical protein
MDAIRMILLIQGEIDQAEALLGKAVSFRRRALGEKHGGTAIAMYCMADRRRRESQLAEAEPSANATNLQALA